MENKNIPCLKLTRFCGEEFYPIKKAIWQIFEDVESNINELWLNIETDFGTVLHEDTKELEAQPHWELLFRAENLNVNDLTTGFRAEIPCGYSEDFFNGSLASFYYCEHEPSDNNVIEILATEGTRLLIRIMGEITDVNYYDGSKPKNKILIEAWFEML